MTTPPAPSSRTWTVVLPAIGAFLAIFAANGNAMIDALLGFPRLFSAWAAVLPGGVWSCLGALILSMGGWGFAMRYLHPRPDGRAPQLGADLVAIALGVAVTWSQVLGKPAGGAAECAMGGPGRRLPRACAVAHDLLGLLPREDAAVKAPPLQFYIDANNRWRWRLRSPNGLIVADSAEGDGYRNKANARKGARAALKLLQEALG